MTRQTARDPLLEMTEREREVLHPLGAGLPNKLIARRLGISEGTLRATSPAFFASSASITAPKPRSGPANATYSEEVSDVRRGPPRPNPIARGLSAERPRGEEALPPGDARRLALACRSSGV